METRTFPRWFRPSHSEILSLFWGQSRPQFDACILLRTNGFKATVPPFGFPVHIGFHQGFTIVRKSLSSCSSYIVTCMFFPIKIFHVRLFKVAFVSPQLRRSIARLSKTFHEMFRKMSINSHNITTRPIVTWVGTICSLHSPLRTTFK